MKILCLTNLLPPHSVGGYENICATVVEEMRRRGHEVEVLTSNHHVPGKNSGGEHGVERKLRLHGLYGHPWLGIRDLAELERFNNETLALALARFQPDVVYVWNMGGLSKSLLLALQRQDMPAAFYVSDHWIARGLASDVWLRWWNSPGVSWKARAMRSFWTMKGERQRHDARAPTNPIRDIQFRRPQFCSKAMRDLTEKAGYAVGHGAVIHCPIHRRFTENDLTPVDRPLRRLLFAGRLERDKGVMTALKALAFLKKQGKGDFTLHLYGRGDASYQSELEQFARENALPASFHAGAAEEMPRIYHEHDALLFTSEWEEPFALTPLEAMASGAPVIGTMTGGSPELFRHGENALTYAAGSAEELANRIAFLAGDDALRRRCAQKGFHEAREKFAAPVIVDRIESHLKETCEQWNTQSRPPAARA